MMHETSLLHTQVPETFLRKLLRRYPHGKVFNFDEEGSLSSSEEDVRKLLREGIENTSETAQLLPTDAKLRKRGKRKMAREAEAKEILHLLPSARCVAFFLLWDSHVSSKSPFYSLSTANHMAAAITRVLPRLFFALDSLQLRFSLV